jgi:hypothetical protein
MIERTTAVKSGESFVMNQSWPNVRGRGYKQESRTSCGFLDSKPTVKAAKQLGRLEIAFLMPSEFGSF